MKRFTSVIVTLALMLCLMAGCSSKTSETTVDDTPVAVGGQETVNVIEGTNSDGEGETTIVATAYDFFFAGQVVELGTNPDSVIDSLGEHQTFESVSCAYQGTDYVYQFASFDIKSTPDSNGNNVIVSIILYDDTVATSNGIYVGMSADEVKAIMGEATNELPGGLEYVNGDKSVMFMLVDGVVGEIDYTYAVK